MARRIGRGRPVGWTTAILVATGTEEMLFLGFHDDRDDARELARRLRRAGIDLWCSADREGRKVSSAWPDEAVDAIHAAEGFIALLGKNGLGGGLVDEVSHALARRRNDASLPIVPIALPSAARDHAGHVEVPKKLFIFEVEELPLDWRTRDDEYFRELATRRLGWKLPLTPGSDGRSKPVEARTGSSPTPQLVPWNAYRLPLQMVRIPGGSFLMGSDQSLKENERPAHSVNVKAFELSAFELTRGQYRAVMGNAKKSTQEREWRSWVRADLNAWELERLPATHVNWLDAVQFLNALSVKEGLAPCYSVQGLSWRLNTSANGYRLPSEAEWEYACRAGTASEYWSGHFDRDLERVGWHSGNAREQLHPVGQKEANPFGLHDMHGNVWEMCEDSWHASYQGAPQDGYAWVDEASEERVVRGGSFGTSADFARSAFRNGLLSLGRGFSVGFRPARSATTG